MKHDHKLHRPHHGRPKRAMPVQQALEWAFGVEKAQLELPPREDHEERYEARGYSMEYVLLRQAVLGCKVDGGRYKMGHHTHPDAEVIAATVAMLPDALGGKRMALRLTELARAGVTPDWMPGAVPRCIPAETKRNRYGDHATTVVVGTERVLSRGKWRTVEVRACPAIWRPHQQQIDAARKGYEDWWQALGWIRDGVIEGRMLRELEVVEGMPKLRPWFVS